MAEKVQAIRGMNDILPAECKNWRNVEKIFADCLFQYGYEEIRFPILESTNLFKRSIGEVTDIVEKEMYTFIDLNGESISLRPEGTAGCLRACLEHGLLYNQQQKLWYIGPMFRHEKPQKGRYRQFHQFGVEAIGLAGVAHELELIQICNRIWKKLGICKTVTLEVNTIGELSERNAYKESLVIYLQNHFEKLDSDSQRRLNTNPLRILDSKNSDTQKIVQNAPKLFDFLSDNSKNHFKQLCEGLDALRIPYTINPLLVRGLDYYSHTVFEWVTDKLGSQGTICAGGRYDKLVEQLGGNTAPAVGFAVGVERLLLLLETREVNLQACSKPVFFIISDKDGSSYCNCIAEDLRDYNSDWQILTPIYESSFKSQFKKADKSAANFALIVGASELLHKEVSIKNLRKKEEQVTIPVEKLASFMSKSLS